MKKWASGFEHALVLSLGLTIGLLVACVDSGADSSCDIGALGCSCYPGNVCLTGLTCLSNLCVDLDGGETTGPHDPGDGDPDDGETDSDTGPGDGDGDPGDTGDPCGAGAEILLYEQGFDFSNDPGIPAGSFSDFDGKAVEVADDFVIPEDESCWCITRVVTWGFYQDNIEPPSTPDVIVEFFNHVPAGVPQVDPTHSYTTAPLMDDSGDFDVAIDEDIILAAGTHWFSFRPILNSQEAYWDWKVHNTLFGDIAAARDKDAILFGGGVCAGWTPAIGCYDIEPSHEYYELTTQFQLYGVIGGQECN